MKFTAQPTSFPVETLYAEDMTGEDASFSIIAPPPDAPMTPLVFASPHSGVLYPTDMAPAVGLDDRSLRSAEDALVDRLVEAGPAHGAPLIAGRIGRAYVDLNRDPDELDPRLIVGIDGPAGPKTAAGYGVLPRLAGDGAPLYDRRLTPEEAERRLATAHRPYHAALAGLMETARTRFGRAVLVDWHSMPRRAADADVVLGNRHGASCRGEATRLLASLFEAEGWRVALNQPYAGGWSTQRWGLPDEGFEAVQVELNRRLYFDEEARTPAATFAAARRALTRVIAALCAAPWPAVRR